MASRSTADTKAAAPSERGLESNRDGLIAIGLGLVALLLYWEAQFYSQFTVDDALYLTTNEVVPGGLTVSGIWTAFTSIQVANYHPVTMLTFMAEQSLFDSSIRMAHLVNILFHAANTVLVFHLLRLMTGQSLAAAMVAALFAVHPVHVEPVVWISSRKDVLSTFFWLVCLVCYARYVQSENRRDYWVGFVALCAGLLSKQMLVTVPFLLCLLDYWPLGRYENERISVSRVFELSREKAVYFGAIVAFSLIALWAQSRSGAVRTTDQIPLLTRGGNMWFAYVAYLAQAIVPIRLQITGYQTPLDLGMWKTLLAMVFILIVSLWAVLMRRRAPYLPVGWFWFVGTMVPVIGLISLGTTYRADRYAYMPILGLFVIGVWGSRALLDRYLGDRARSASILLAVAVLGCYGQMASNTISLWKNNLDAHKHTLSINSAHYMAGISLGHEYRNRQRIPQAIEAYARVLEHHPHLTDGTKGMAEMLIRIGNDRQASVYIRRHLLVTPNSAWGYVELARVMVRLNDPNGARAVLHEGLAILPEHPDLTETLNRLNSDFPE